MFFIKKGAKVLWEADSHKTAKIGVVCSIELAAKAYAKRSQKRLENWRETVRKNAAHVSARTLYDKRATAGKTAVGVTSTSRRDKTSKEKIPVFIQPPGLKAIPIGRVRSDGRLRRSLKGFDPEDRVTPIWQPSPYALELKKRKRLIQEHVQVRIDRRAREAEDLRRAEAERKAQEAAEVAAQLEKLKQKKAWGHVVKNPFPDLWYTKPPRLQPWDSPEDRELKERFRNLYGVTFANQRSFASKTLCRCTTDDREWEIAATLESQKTNLISCKRCKGIQWVFQEPTH